MIDWNIPFKKKFGSKNIISVMLHVLRTQYKMILGPSIYLELGCICFREMIYHCAGIYPCCIYMTTS